MTYYADLSPYEYLDHDQPMLNIGWLDRAHPFPTGDVGAETYGRLVDLAVADRAHTRGWHYCQFCDEESPIRLASHRGRDVVLLGHSEIRVEDAAGQVYAAPTLVCHYVGVHGYLPPHEFLDAVRAGGPAPLDQESLAQALWPAMMAHTARTYRAPW